MHSIYGTKYKNNSATFYPQERHLRKHQTILRHSNNSKIDVKKEEKNVYEDAVTWQSSRKPSLAFRAIPVSIIKPMAGG